MTTAEIIAIGTELLLGDSQDTNTPYIARLLRDQGINLYRTTMVGDNEGRISDVIRESLSRVEIVILTGGLGPTVDDPTRAAVAKAAGVPLEFQQELWNDIQTRFAMMKRPITDNNRIQAYIPAGAIAVNNPVGTAPAFIVELGEKVIVSLPGVPGEMEIILQESIINYIRNKYNLTGIIKARVIHTSGIGESMVDNLISDLEKQDNPTVGLLAHPGQVDIRITAQAKSIQDAEKMIELVRQMIYDRLRENIFGEDADTLEDIVSKNLLINGHNLTIFDSLQNLPSNEQFSKSSLPWAISFFSSECLTKSDFINDFSQFSSVHTSPILGIWGDASAKKYDLELILLLEGKTIDLSRVFAGPPGSTRLWIRNTILDFLRRNLG
jgi:nicotinamide-nucleotide amidase